MENKNKLQQIIKAIKKAFIKIVRCKFREDCSELTDNSFDNKKKNSRFEKCNFMDIDNLKTYRLILKELKRHKDFIDIVTLKMNINIEMEQIMLILRIMRKNGEIHCDKNFEQIRLI